MTPLAGGWRTRQHQPPVPNRARHAALLAVLAGALVTRGAEAKQLASDRPEAWAMNHFTSLTLLTGLDVPHPRKLASLDLGFELDWVPSLSPTERRVGFNGTKEEDLNKAPVFARPRVTVGLPWNIGLVLGYLPPIKIFGVTPNLFDFALERPLYERPPWTVSLRAYGQIGHLEGAFTCSRENVEARPGSSGNPLGCQKTSSDVATQRYGGLELIGVYRIEQARGLEAYVSMAGNFLDTMFQVKAQEFGGVQDRTRLASSTWTYSVNAGFVYPLTSNIRVGVGLFYSPLWIRRPGESSELDGLFNVRSMVTYRWR